MDLVLKNQQRLIWHKTQPTNHIYFPQQYPLHHKHLLNSCFKSWFFQQLSSFIEFSWFIDQPKIRALKSSILSFEIYILNVNLILE